MYSWGLILIILCLPTYFIWQWLFKKIIKNEGSRKIAVWLATLILSPLIVYGIMVLKVLMMIRNKQP